MRCWIFGICSCLRTFLVSQHSLDLLEVIPFYQISEALGCFVGCDQPIGNKISAHNNFEQPFGICKSGRFLNIIIVPFGKVELVLVLLIMKKML